MSQSALERFLRNVNRKKSIVRNFLAIRTMFSVLAIAITATVAIAASDTGIMSHADGAKMYLLTEMQYRQIIKDTFGADIEFTGVFAQEDRADGLLAVSSGQTSISDAQLQSFDAMARKVADQVTAPQHRRILIPCQPENPKKADNACATKFIRNVGLRIFRRPLNEQELTLQVAAAGQAAEKVHNFYDGLSISLSSMLMAPEFLFCTETITGAPGNQTLDDYSRASRLSFFLWNRNLTTNCFAQRMRGSSIPHRDSRLKSIEWSSLGGLNMECGASSATCSISTSIPAWKRTQ